MILFHCDLDNTLIYSYKHPIGPAKRCVEVYEGREVSFMLPCWLESLACIRQKAVFVPTTTRTAEQYRRVDFGAEEPEYALVCNGGVLLRGGVPDPEWYRESLELIADARDGLLLAAELLERDENRSLEVRLVERLFVFTKSRRPEKTLEELRERLDPERVDVYRNGEKIYCMPKRLKKGDAVLRLRRLTGAERILSAGDSEFDLSMLAVSDMGFCPEGLAGANGPNIRRLPRESFTGGMLEMIRMMCR